MHESNVTLETAQNGGAAKSETRLHSQQALLWDGMSLDDMPSDDAALNEISELLFELQREKLITMQMEIDQLRRELAAAERRLTDPDYLVELFAPIIGRTLRKGIFESRSDVVAALSPIAGRMVMRAVSEAFNDLAQRIDSQMRVAFDVKSLQRRLRGRLLGLSDSELIIRGALPFSVSEVFFIHRETGLLLHHLSLSESTADENDPSGESTGAGVNDSDVISGMLTAVRGFVQDAFGQNRSGDLDGLQYGANQILIEEGSYSYLAVVTDGVVPSGFRTLMREQLFSLESQYIELLEVYTGDASAFSEAHMMLVSLAEHNASSGLSSKDIHGSTTAAQKAAKNAENSRAVAGSVKHFASRSVASALRTRLSTAGIRMWLVATALLTLLLLLLLWLNY